MKPKTKIDTNPMDEAYKLLDAKPSATGVSDAAQGLAPKNDDEDFRENEEEQLERQYGGGKPRPASCDIDDAYAMLFESLAVIMRHK